MNFVSGLRARSFQRKMLGLALLAAAGICLLVSILLAIFDRVAAGSLTAALFVICVLLYHLPQMESVQAFGVKAKWRRQKAQLAETAKAEAEQSVTQLAIQIATNAPKEKLLETANTAVTKLSTANSAVGAALTALESPEFSATTPSEGGQASK
jgi:hypothetical protein